MRFPREVPEVPADNEVLRVLGLRLEAFGGGDPIHDWDRHRTYMPDGSVDYWRSYRSIRDLMQASHDHEVCKDLEAALDDLPPA